MTKKLMGSEAALIELQILLMDQQRSLDDLSAQLIAQADKILALQKQVEWLQSRLALVDESAEQKKMAGDEKPPHY